MATGSHTPSQTYKSYWTEGSGASGSGLTYDGDNIKFGYVFDENTYDKDVNNYNFAKLEETLSNMADQDWLKKQLIDICYPVGSIYISTSATNQPPSATGITWDRIEDCFLYAAVDDPPSEGYPDYRAGQTGGDKALKLVRHYHPYSGSTSLPYHTHNLDSNGTTVTFDAPGGLWNADKRLAPVSTADKARYYLSNGDRNGAKVNLTGKTSGVTGTNPTISISGNTQSAGTIDETGNISPNTANMPPYLCVYMWKRTT